MAKKRIVLENYDGLSEEDYEFYEEDYEFYHEAYRLALSLRVSFEKACELLILAKKLNRGGAVDGEQVYKI